MATEVLPFDAQYFDAFYQGGLIGPDPTVTWEVASGQNRTNFLIPATTAYQRRVYLGNASISTVLGGSEPGSSYSLYSSSKSEINAWSGVIATSNLVRVVKIREWDIAGNYYQIYYVPNATFPDGYWPVVGTPGVTDNPETPSGVDITIPGDEWAAWPDDPTERPGVGGGGGGVPSPYLDVTLPEGPDGPPLLEVVNPPDENAPSFRLPPGSLGDAPIRAVIVGRLLYIYYGGEKIITYIIPQAQYTALTVSSFYVGYVNTSTFAEAVAPITVTIELASPGYEFGAGVFYRTLTGRTDMADGHRLFTFPHWKIDAVKDYLITGGVTVVTECPTQTEIDAADKHIAGGREGQPTMTYAEAIQAANEYQDAGIVTPVQP